MVEPQISEYAKRTYRLSDEELLNLQTFESDHGCKPDGEDWEECTLTTLSVTITDTSIGSYIRARCELCGKEKDVSDKDRLRC